jgi:hypothetical protein
MMNLISLSDGHVDVLRGVLRFKIQELMATDDPHPKLVGAERNYDKAAHLLTIYDLLGDVASKWNGELPQIGCRPIPPDESYRPLLEVDPARRGSLHVYLARDGSLKNVPAVD